MFNSNFIRQDQSNARRHQTNEEKKPFRRISRRYHLKISSTADENHHHGLMLILPGVNRACSDLCHFNAIRTSRFAGILCRFEKSFLVFSSCLEQPSNAIFVLEIIVSRADQHGANEILPQFIH